MTDEAGVPKIVDRTTFDTELEALRLKLQPCLGDGNVVGPRIETKTRLGRLRERPKGKMLCARKSARIQIPASILFEGDVKARAIELATLSNVAVDRPKTRNEKDFRAYVRGCILPLGC